jgi:hypothetical protein
MSTFGTTIKFSGGGALADNAIFNPTGRPGSSSELNVPGWLSTDCTTSGGVGSGANVPPNGYEYRGSFSNTAANGGVLQDILKTDKLSDLLYRGKNSGPLTIAPITGTIGGWFSSDTTSTVTIETNFNGLIYQFPVNITANQWTYVNKNVTFPGNVGIGGFNEGYYKITNGTNGANSYFTGIFFIPGISDNYNAGEPTDLLWSKEREIAYKEWLSFKISGVGPTGLTDEYSIPFPYGPFAETPTFVTNINSSANVTGVSITDITANCATIKVDVGTNASFQSAVFPTTPGTAAGNGNLYTFSLDLDIQAYVPSLMDAV